MSLRKINLISFVTFFVGWWLYFSQGMFNYHGPIMQGILVVMLTWSFFYFFKVVTTKQVPPVLQVLALLLIVLLLYGVWNIIIRGGGTYAIDYVKKTAYSIAPIFGFYYLLKRIDVSQKWLYVIIIALLLFAIGEFYSGRREMLEKIARGIYRDREINEMVMGAAYRFLPILPLLFFVKKAWFKYMALIVILFYIVLGVKRGAILIGAASTAIIVFDELTHTKKKTSISQIIIVIGALVGGYFLFSKMITENDFFIYRFAEMMEGDTSGRDKIYSEMFQHFVNESNAFYLLFGNGADSTLRIQGHYAHNDWLEMLMNQGVFGFLIYFIFYYRLIKEWIRNKECHTLYMGIGLVLFVLFGSSIVSMSINNMRITAHFCIAYCLAMSEKPRYSNKTNNYENLCN